MEPFSVLVEARPFAVGDPDQLQRLRADGMTVTDMRGSGMDDAAFREALAGADAVLCGNDLIVDHTLFQRAPKLKAVAKLGAGLDTVDIDAATRHGAIVFHTPGANNQAVADHTFALILGVARKILYCDRSLRESRWEHTRIMGSEIWQKTLGLIGLGAIGRMVAMRAQGFQMTVVAHDPFWPEPFAEAHGIQQCEIEDLLARSDIVSLHLPLTSATAGLMDREALARMKPTAILINAARGGLVNEADLVSALETGRIAGAGLDVFEQEPPVGSPLLALENVVLTPHTAAFTHEAMHNMNVGIVDQLLAYRRGDTPEHVVNPEAANP